MTIAHTLTIGAGRFTDDLFSKTITFNGGAELNLDESVPAPSTDLAISCALVRAKVDYFAMTADRDMTLKVNSAAAAVNEVQRLTMGGTVTGGTFTITFSGQTTGAIQWNAAADAVETALEALTNIDVGDVLVTGGPFPGAAVDIQFLGQYAAVNVAEVTVASSLTGTGPTITPSTVTQGSGGTKSFALKANKPLIWHPDLGVTAAQFFGPADLVNLYATLTAGAASVLRIRSLYDPT